MVDSDILRSSRDRVIVGGPKYNLFSALDGLRTRTIHYRLCYQKADQCLNEVYSVSCTSLNRLGSYQAIDGKRKVESGVCQPASRSLGSTEPKN